MDGWDISLLAVAGYLAVTSLVRLMRARRDRLVAELLDEAERQPRSREPKPENSPPAGRAA